MTYDEEHLFLCSVDEISGKDFDPFFNWVVFLFFSVKSSLYMLSNCSLSDVCFANIFPQSAACFLIHLILSFAEQKFLILRKSILSIISFMDCVFGGVSKKASAYKKSARFSPLISSKSFIVLHFIFRSVIHVH